MFKQTLMNGTGHDMPLSPHLRVEVPLLPPQELVLKLRNLGAFASCENFIGIGWLPQIKLYTNNMFHLLGRPCFA